MKTPKPRWILILSLLGMANVLITIISDFILLGKPSSAYSFLMLGTETMWDIAPWRITAGSFIGVMALPFQLLGLVPVYVALKPAGKVLPVIALIMNAHTLLMGVAFHISYAYIGSSWTLHRSDVVTRYITSGLVDKYDSYWFILAVIMFLELLISSAIYVIIVLKGKSLFPRWMAIFNHLCVVLFVFPIILVLPYPIGGYIGPAILNISTMVYFIITLVVCYRRVRKAEAHEPMDKNATLT